MYLATRKHPQTFIWKKLPINDQVMQRVNDLNTKENKPKITKGYLFFEWIPGIPIKDQSYREQKTEDDKITSTHGDEDNDKITKNEEEYKNIEGKAYDQE